MMNKESRIIQVSFKKTTKDIRIYSYVDSLEEKSLFIKEAIAYYISNLNKSENLIRCSFIKKTEEK